MTEDEARKLAKARNAEGIPAPDGKKYWTAKAVLQFPDELPEGYSEAKVPAKKSKRAPKFEFPKTEDHPKPDPTVFEDGDNL